MSEQQELTTQEVAEHLDVTQQHVSKLIRDGLLHAHKEGRDYRIKPADLRAYEKIRQPVGRPKGNGKR
jgi:excisionase family DNA binding protein